MGILPYERLTIETTLTVEEAQRRLAESVEPRKNIGWPLQQRSKPFEGSITDEHFEISRVISYRNSFLPRISGRIRQGSQGATIEATLALHVVVMIFMIVWLLGVGCAALVVLSAAIGAGTFELFGLIPIGMFVFGVLLCTLGFNFEAAKAKSLLKQLFA
jgi:hypothetical protein